MRLFPSIIVQINYQYLQLRWEKHTCAIPFSMHQFLTVNDQIGAIQEHIRLFVQKYRLIFPIYTINLPSYLYVNNKISLTSIPRRDRKRYIACQAKVLLDNDNIIFRTTDNQTEFTEIYAITIFTLNKIRGIFRNSIIAFVGLMENRISFVVNPLLQTLAFILILTVLIFSNYTLRNINHKLADELSCNQLSLVQQKPLHDKYENYRKEYVMLKSSRILMEKNIQANKQLGELLRLIGREDLPLWWENISIDQIDHTVVLNGYAQTESVVLNWAKENKYRIVSIMPCATERFIGYQFELKGNHAV